MEPPILETARLFLRPFVLSDAPDVQRLAGAPEVADTTLNLPHPYEIYDAEQWISSQPARFASSSSIAYAITRRTDGTLLGAISLMEISARHRRAELGYWLGVPFWNQGYMTEAAAALIGYGFSEIGLHKITAAHFIRNPASGRVMQKLGMCQEGVQRGQVCKNGVFEDNAVYGLLAEEWQEQSQLPGGGATVAPAVAGGAGVTDEGADASIAGGADAGVAFGGVAAWGDGAVVTVGGTRVGGRVDAAGG